MEFKTIILIPFVVTWISYVDAMTCLSCDQISHPRYCHVVSKCGPREVCYVKAITSADHTRAYELGCTDPNINQNSCNTTAWDPAGQRCYECCNNDLCNAGLCGQRGYPQDRGPICYACDSRLRGEACNFIDFCEKEEVCSVNQRIEFGEVIYTNECSQKHVCEGHSLTVVGKRTIPVCSACCTSDLCNVNCTYHTQTDYCLDDTCKNGGTCVNGTYGAVCHCPIGFGGKRCDPDPCHSSPCKNGAGCMTVDSGYVCVCPQGYHGLNCETRIDPCLSAPCINNGTCSASGQNFICTCPGSFTGSRCEIDPCGSSHCENGGTCSIANNTFVCTCPAGIGGDRCEIDPCATANCQNGAPCQGFGAQGYVCVCPVGYVGLHCENDACSSGPCANGGACSVVNGNYSCACTPVYTGDTCEKATDPCKSGPCSNGGNCSVVGDSYSCACPGSFTGTQCEQDPCFAKPCLNGGACMVLGTDYYCACPANYKGKHCELDPCQANSCSNGGTCTVLSNDFKCTCPQYFTGRHCEIGLCSANACKNGGTCLDGAGGFKCFCQPLFYGHACEMSLCQPGICQNGGTCQDSATGHVCTCVPGFSGKDCEAATVCGSDTTATNTTELASLWLPITDRIVEARCDVKTAGGGWLIFQNRFDGDLLFNRSFSEYKNGFGDAHGEYWLGLDITKEVMAQCPRGDWELRVDMVDGNGLPGYELFQTFSLGPAPNYTLILGPGQGTAIRYTTQDLGLAYHNGSNFSTFDHEVSSANCAALDHGGWWYYNCAYVNLNGRYMKPPGTIAKDQHGGESGMIYYSFDRTNSLKSSQMKIRLKPSSTC